MNYNNLALHGTEYIIIKDLSKFGIEMDVWLSARLSWVRHKSRVEKRATECYVFEWGTQIGMPYRNMSFGYKEDEHCVQGMSPYIDDMQSFAERAVAAYFRELCAIEKHLERYRGNDPFSVDWSCKVVQLDWLKHRLRIVGLPQSAASPSDLEADKT